VNIQQKKFINNKRLTSLHHQPNESTHHHLLRRSVIKVNNFGLSDSLFVHETISSDYRFSLRSRNPQLRLWILSSLNSLDFLRMPKTLSNSYITLS